MNGRAYIAGPISGLPDGNREAFAELAAKLARSGWVVLNPREGELSAAACIEAQDLGDDYRSGALYRAVLRECFQTLLSCSRVYALPGWCESTGATRELRLAAWAGIPAFYAPTGERILLDE